jgi:tripartite ATP-independent transporter DctM subunit
MDIPMEARYADEKSNLSIRRVLLEFPLKHARNLGKRIFYNYFLRDFSVASIELLLGLFLLVFGVVMGSLYFGIATATESAALGVTTVVLFVLKSGRLNWALLRGCFISTARVSGMILLIIAAAFILNLTISLTGVAEIMTKWVTGLGLSKTTLILGLILFYLLLGMFMDVLSMMVATIPITYPIAMALGVDPIWFGIFVILMCELGLITPPVGMNLFVVHGIRPDKGGIEDVMWGALPYAIIIILFTIFLMIFPEIVTWLPNQM